MQSTGQTDERDDGRWRPERTVAMAGLGDSDGLMSICIHYVANNRNMADGHEKDKVLVTLTK